MLGHIACTQVGNVPSMVVHMADDAPVGQFAQQRTDEGGFTRAVLPDEHSQLTAVDVHGHIVQQRLPAP